MLCKRCKDNEVTVVSRKEPFCDACFVKFVGLKQRKRMMTDEFYRDHFKVLYGKDLKNDGISKIILPFDFGTSCLTALDVLLGLMKEQRVQHRGKHGFTIDVITVYKDDEERGRFEEMFNKLKLFDRYDSELWTLVNYHIINADVFFTNTKEFRQIVLHNQNFNSMAINMSLENNKNYSVQEMLSSCPNRNTRNDFWTFIINHIVKKFAYQQKDAEIILWGHSMTKLADQIIGLIVKGRGAQIASTLDSQIFDQEYDSKFKNLFPLKDILLSELDAYCFVTGLYKFIINYIPKYDLLHTKPNLNDLPQASTNVRLVKNMTINELARKYFDDIEGEYSNIIATVLRTGDKLRAPEITTNPEHESNNENKCTICQNTIYSEPVEWLRNIAVNRGHAVETEEEEELYQQWESSHVGMQNKEYLSLRNKVWEEGNHVSLCYGCIINLNGMKSKEIVWPKHGNDELQNILNEYEL